MRAASEVPTSRWSDESRRMKRSKGLAAAALLATAALASLSPAKAIKQSQLGEADWLSRYVGKVAHAEFAASGRPRVYIATESNVVACLNLRDGDIIWRQVLPYSQSGCITLSDLHACRMPVADVQLATLAIVSRGG